MVKCGQCGHVASALQDPIELDLCSCHKCGYITEFSADGVARIFSMEDQEKFPVKIRQLLQPFNEDESDPHTALEAIAHSIATVSAPLLAMSMLAREVKPDDDDVAYFVMQWMHIGGRVDDMCQKIAADKVKELLSRPENGGVAEDDSSFRAVAKKPKRVNLEGGEQSSNGEGRIISMRIKTAGTDDE